LQECINILEASHFQMIRDGIDFDLNKVIDYERIENTQIDLMKAFKNNINT